MNEESIEADIEYYRRTAQRKMAEWSRCCQIIDQKAAQLREIKADTEKAVRLAAPVDTKLLLLDLRTSRLSAGRGAERGGTDDFNKGFYTGILSHCDRLIRDLEAGEFRVAQ